MGCSQRLRGICEYTQSHFRLGSIWKCPVLFFLGLLSDNLRPQRYSQRLKSIHKCSEMMAFTNTGTFNDCLQSYYRLGHIHKHAQSHLKLGGHSQWLAAFTDIHGVHRVYLLIQFHFRLGKLRNNLPKDTPTLQSFATIIENDLLKLIMDMPTKTCESDIIPTKLL